MPKSAYPQYETLKAKFAKAGESLAAAKTRAAKITNTAGGKVPPSHPKSRRKPV